MAPSGELGRISNRDERQVRPSVSPQLARRRDGQKGRKSVDRKFAASPLLPAIPSLIAARLNSAKVRGAILLLSIDSPNFNCVYLIIEELNVWSSRRQDQS
jgi:hypothetical protein